MAELTELDLECLEYEIGPLLGLLGVSWGCPELVSQYAGRYAFVLSSLGRFKESSYQAMLAGHAVGSIGRPARKAWRERPLRRRLLAGPGGRRRWEDAYTESFFIEAEDNLRKVRDDVAGLRAQIAHHFNEDGRTGHRSGGLPVEEGRWQ